MRPGADGILGTADDIHETRVNTTTPFVDQNQTYTSHPSHQVFLREYELDADGDPVATGKLIANRTWAPTAVRTARRRRDRRHGHLGRRQGAGARPARHQADRRRRRQRAAAARPILRQLHPRRRTASPQVVIDGAAPTASPDTADDVLVEGNPAAPIAAAPTPCAPATRS